MTKVLGVHFLLDVYDCNPLLLDDIDFLDSLLRNVAAKAEMHILNATYHKFEPQGVSLLFLISESHISIHTFPEYSCATLDVYSCGSPLKLEVAIQELIKTLGCSYKVQRIDRGVIDVHEV